MSTTNSDDRTPGIEHSLETTVSESLWARSVKRPVDVVLGVTLLALIFPLLALAGAAILISSPGPLLFRQERIGRDGASFMLLKLRSMRAGRRPDPKELVPLHHPEITPVGRWLRRLKIDELPQLINVIAGEMSLVGPRPTLPDQVARYDAFRRRRLVVRPGITGLAQVHGNTTLSWDQRILFDIAYVQTCSFRLDVSIMWRTLGTIVAGENKSPIPFDRTPYRAFVTPPPGYGSDRDDDS